MARMISTSISQKRFTFDFFSLSQYRTLPTSNENRSVRRVYPIIFTNFLKNVPPLESELLLIRTPFKSMWWHSRSLKHISCYTRWQNPTVQNWHGRNNCYHRATEIEFGKKGPWSHNPMHYFLQKTEYFLIREQSEFSRSKSDVDHIV